MELLFRKIGCLLCIPWPGHPPVFESFIQKQKSRPHPEQSFTAVRPLAAEEEKCPFFKWILSVLIPDDHCKPINPLPEVNCSAGKDHTPDPCRILKHWTPPAGSCSEEIRKSRSEEHTSELQSRFDLVCRLLLEKKKEHNKTYI